MKWQNQTAAFVVSGTALLVVAVSLISNIAGRTGVTDPRVRIVTETTAERGAATRNQRFQAVQQALTGEVATTAQRLQEAVALATAASLLLASEAVRGRMPASETDLIAALFKQKLAPQGFSLGQQAGTVRTPSGMLIVRYRRAPIGVEVFAIGSRSAMGQAILVRVPDDERGNESGVWLAGSLEEIALPRPFASAAELLAAGWQADALPNVR